MEALETRNLLTVAAPIPGVSLTNGVLSIQGTQFSGNHASVSMVQGNVEVTLNGQTEDFATRVVLISYNSGAGGNDTFSNNTAIRGIEFGWGDSNTFTGGSNMDVMLFFGNNETAHSNGGREIVFTHGGTGDTNDPGALVI
jgi:hypothetical protein